MSTAVFAPALAGKTSSAPSRLSLIGKRVLNALIESRARSVARELRRHEAFIQDLSRRQDHSEDFLIQSNELPIKL